MKKRRVNTSNNHSYNNNSKNSSRGLNRCAHGPDKEAGNNEGQNSVNSNLDDSVIKKSSSRKLTGNIRIPTNRSGNR